MPPLLSYDRPPASFMPFSPTPAISARHSYAAQSAHLFSALAHCPSAAPWTTSLSLRRATHW
eukprot:6214449-Pleurochrysis_carterae.AAC.3